jgi:hypothetical protein
VPFLTNERADHKTFRSVPIWVIRLGGGIDLALPE